MPPKKSARSASRGRPSSAAKSPAASKKKSAATPAKSPAASKKKASTSSKSPAPPAKTPPATPKSAKKTPAKSAKKASPKKSSKKAPSTPRHQMEFDEGDNIMARWPGTSLFFKAKVMFVRDDDNEYDVQYEDGTVFTIKAKDVKASKSLSSGAAKTPSRGRSRSRGRSPGRKSTASSSKSKASPGRTPTTKSPSRAAVRAPPPDPTPTRTSARLAAAKVALSSDEEGRTRKAVPNPSHPRKASRGLLPDWDLSWLQALFFIVLGPALLLTLHTLAKDGTWGPKMPTLSRKPADYWHRDSFLAVFSFLFALRVLNYLPLGSTVRAASGQEVRMNGFFSLLAILAVVPVLVYRKVDVSFASDNYFHLMTSALLLSLMPSTVCFFLARWGRRSNANPKGNTGNFIVDWYRGREFNPYFRGDVKLMLYRGSNIALALLNVLLVLQSVNDAKGKVNPTVVVAAAFQVVYAMDALFNEEYFFFSHDAMNTGLGFGLVSSYFAFPFIPTLITKYMIARSVSLPAAQLIGVAVLNALGYVIFRSSETQRCEFAKNPSQPQLRNLRTIATAGGRKILAGGWWGLVRYPNYLGEILMQWSWVLPAATVAGRADLLVYFLPIFTTVTLLARTREQNTRNKRKYGHAWDNYCSEVPANIVPKIY